MTLKQRHPMDVLADDLATGKKEMRVNDKRRVVIGDTNDPNKDKPVDHAEAVYAAIYRAVDSYCRSFRDSAGNTIRVPTERLEDMARHATANVLALEAGDPREWVAVEAKALKTGDVFVSYDVVAGLAVDEQCTVIRVRGGSKFDERAIDVSGQRSGHRTIQATDTYVFRVHRPKVSIDDVRNALAEDL